MRFTAPLAAAAGIALAAAGTAAAATVHAGDLITTADGSELCTLGAVHGGRAITAGHCGSPGEQLRWRGTHGTDADEVLGTVIADPEDGGGTDYAVIDLADGVTGDNTVTRIDGAALGSLGGPVSGGSLGGGSLAGASGDGNIDGFTGDVSFGDPVCNYGQTTGKTCGIVLADTGDSTLTTASVLFGDSGGPVTTTVDGTEKVFGVNSRVLVPGLPLSWATNVCTDAVAADGFAPDCG